MNLTQEFTILDDKVNKNLEIIYEKFRIFTDNINSSFSQQDLKLNNFYDNVMKKSEILDLQVQQAALECNAAVTQRKRDHSDNQSEFRKIHSIFETVHKKNDSLAKNIDNFNRSLQLLVECSKLTHALQLQDELDRESIALYGVKDSKHVSNRSLSLSKPSMTIDKQCLSCSGQPNFVTTAFKIACLAYSPTSILFKDTVYERSEMIEIHKRILDGITDELLCDISGIYDNAKQSYSMKPNQWRPLSRMSNLSQHMASATPDLPPLSFPKKNNH